MGYILSYIAFEIKNEYYDQQYQIIPQVQEIHGQYTGQQRIQEIFSWGMDGKGTQPFIYPGNEGEKGN